MVRRVAAVLLALVAFGPGTAGLAAAQTAQPPARVLDSRSGDLPPDVERDLMVLHFTAAYTNTVLIGLVSGGVIGNMVFGGLAAAAIGGILGASLGSVWFFSRLATEYEEMRQNKRRLLEFPWSILP